MSTMERLIVERIERKRVNESLYNLGGITDNSTELDRAIEDNLDVLNTMLEKGFQEFPEETAEKRAYREIENKLISLGYDIKPTPVVKKSDLTGEYLTRQEDIIQP